MLETILKEAKISSSVWQALLLAGLIPAGLVLGGWWILNADSSRRESAFNGILQAANHPQSWRDFIAARAIPMSLTIALAVFLWLVRPLTQQLLKRPPLVGFFFRAYQRLRKRNHLLHLHRVLWIYDSLVWYRHGFPVPDHSGQPTPERCPKDLALSENVRRRLISPASSKKWYRPAAVIEWQERRKIKKALFRLYCAASWAELVRIRAFQLSRDDASVGFSPAQIWSSAEREIGVLIPAGWETELEEWRSLAALPGNRALGQLQRVEAAWGSLAAYARAHRVLDQVPADAWLEPTALGNLLAALEEYGTARYSIDVGSLWPRVEPLATKEQLAAIKSSQLNLETCVNITVAFLACALFPVITQLLPSYHSLGWIYSLSFSLTSLALAWISYYGTLVAAELLAGRMKALIDINVLPLLRKLGLQPSTAKQYREMLDAVSAFLVSAEPLPNDLPMASSPTK